MQPLTLLLMVAVALSAMVVVQAQLFPDGEPEVPRPQQSTHYRPHHQPRNYRQHHQFYHPRYFSLLISEKKKKVTET
ncbi:hypothetical protein O3P69_013796 [Scylla paramamosain]|uniref:Uncharacterized protein n=1 Tax=Scylla paramamosain TaxID=85552 RepID=A0AAW0SQM0_SCYPA